MHIHSATEEDILFCCKRFNLEKNIVADALDSYEVPRIEKDDDVTYLFTRFIFGTVNKAKTAPLLVVIGPDFFLTITPAEAPALELFVSREQFHTTQKTKLLLQLLLALNSDFQKYITLVSKDIHRISGDIEEIDNKSLVTFVNHEYLFNELLLGLRADNASLEKLLKGKYVRLFDEDKELIEDLLLANEQLLQMCYANTKYLINIRDSYSTITSNNLNKTMKFLAAITLILTIPTMIFSLYGMNIPLPFQNHPLAFVGVIIGTIVSAGGLLYYFHQTDLL